jgi:molybdopterin converting factor small subunit
MEITVLLFGNLAQIAGATKVTLQDVKDTITVNELLQLKFPEFKNKKYAIAVNNQLIKDVQNLNNGDELAFLPPFSGG